MPTAALRMRYAWLLPAILGVGRAVVYATGSPGAGVAVANVLLVITPLQQWSRGRWRTLSPPILLALDDD